MIFRPAFVTLVTLLFAQFACAQTTRPAVDKKSLGERIDHFTYRSPTLGKPMAFTVVYPANYDATKQDWPVLFFLHGLGRHERTLIEDEESKQKLLEQSYIIVLPKGENGWYIDSITDPKRHYATYLDEVISLAEDTLPISKQRGKRAIGGWSAGGFGSVWACIRKPDSFSTLATIIAVVDHPTTESRFAIPENTFGKDPNEWPKFNPISRAADLKDLNILLVVGDKASDAAMNLKLSHNLTKANIPHEVKHLPGGHTFPTVQGGVELVIEFVAKQLAPAANQLAPEDSAKDSSLAEPKKD